MADDGQENRLIAERRAKLQRLRDAGNAYPNDFRRDALADELRGRISVAQCGVAGRATDRRESRGAPDGQAPQRRYQLREAPGPLGSDPAHGQARSARRGALRRVQEVGFGRRHWRARRSRQEQDGRAVGRRRGAQAARQVVTAVAGEVARHRGRRDEAAPALPRSHHERGDTRGVSAPQRADRASSEATWTRSISPRSRRR